jgi:glutathione synthase/RimK-type ligase-like ATP-grasp enzyme
MGKHVALVNDHRWIDPEMLDDYTRNILLEDRLLSDALGDRGLEVSRVDWADGRIDWRSFDAILIRQTWDYFERLDEFRAWLARVEACTRVINPVDVIRWNCDKRYLVDLAGAGVPTVPTVVVERQHPAPPLGGLIERHEFVEAVVKPAVSGAGRETHRIRRAGAAEFEREWQRLVAQEDMLVQPFMPAIIEHGEVSVVVIDGEVTHAVRKIAAAGEFRVQDDHGGTVHTHAPTEIEAIIARAALAAAPEPVAYARVDLVQTAAGPVVMELELIEPELFFRNAPRAADLLARWLCSRLA